MDDTLMQKNHVIGKSLELYFIDGAPDGMLTAEVFNWTGHVLSVPRTRLAEGLRRQEAGYTGVYLLLGELDGEPLAYIGEGENTANRIRSHDANKDWWSQAVLVTTGANNLNKAHVQYLEARLIDLAKNARRIELENGNVPSLPSLSEAAQANMEGFLKYLLMVLPALRIDIFQEQTRTKVEIDEPDNTVPEFTLFLKKENIRATAILKGSEFIVQAGSMARRDWVGESTKHTTYSKMHDDLVSQGILVLDGKHRVFKESYAFTSTSAAGAVITGRPTSGPLAWKLSGTDQTYSEWEAEELSLAG